MCTELFLNSSGHTHIDICCWKRVPHLKERERKKRSKGWNKEERVGRWHFRSGYGYVALRNVPILCPSLVWKARWITQGDSKRLFKRNDADLCWHTNRSKSCCVFGNRTLPCGTPKRGLNYEENERTFFPLSFSCKTGFCQAGCFVI